MNDRHLSLKKRRPSSDSLVKRGDAQRDDLERSRPKIEPCEQRLALSASLAADWLLELTADQSDLSDWKTSDLANPEQTPLDAAPVAPQSSAPQSSAPLASLMDQAAQLRDTQGLDGSGQTVAVIDSGVAWDHVTLGGGFGPGYRVVGGWDFAENDANPYDDGPAGYHGTHVASLLAGESTLQTELSQNGIAPASDIVALRVFDDAGTGQLEWIESALQWVHENQDSFESPITTVNLSVGAALSDANHELAMGMIEDELALLREDDILVFAAAGNFFDAASDNPSTTSSDLLYPASSPSVVPVASVGSLGELSGFSQRSDGILAAPGESVIGGVPDHVLGWDGNVDDFASLDGTSMATPQVAATSMLVRQSLIDQGMDPTAHAVLDRLQELSRSQQDAVTGLTYRTLDLSGLSSDAIPSPSVIDGFTGSDDHETLTLDLREGRHLKVGDQVHSLSPASADSTIVIDVRGGDDHLEILGSTDAERLILRADGDRVSSLSSNGFTIELRGFENVRFVGGGGADRAALFDSTGDDTLQSQPASATLQGVGFQFDVEDVNRIYVHGTGGGNDTAFLHDSAQDDELFVRPQFTSLKNEATFQLAYGFEKVYAYADQGGFDAIEISDSDGDDTLSISTRRTIIAGPGYNVTASHFESTIGASTNGGNDTARIYADSAAAQGDVQWEVQNDRVQWTGDDQAVRIARGFQRTEAFENFQPIELSTLSLSTLSEGPRPGNHPLLDPWDIDQGDEVEAARKIFAELGI